MKKIIPFFSLLFFFFVLNAQHHQNYGELTISSSNPNIRFWLFIDNSLQNQQPIASIKITNLPIGFCDVRIELNVPDHKTFGQKININRNSYDNIFFIYQNNNNFELNQGKRHIRPEITQHYSKNNENHHAHHQENHHGNQHGNNNNTNSNNPNFNHSPQTPPPTSQRNPCMPTEHFQPFINQIKTEHFDATKLSIAKRFLNRNSVCTEQVIIICQSFSFESTKLEFAKFAYPHCTDINRYSLVTGAFTFDSSKQELLDYISH